MQDEINEKTIALYIKTGKLTAQTLQKAMKTLLAQMKKQKDKTPQGKQTLKQLMKPYYDNDLVVAKPDGSPISASWVSSQFGKLLEDLDMPHIRFHDLRHPYVKHTTKKYFLQKQKSQTIKHTAMVWDSGFFNY